MVFVCVCVVVFLFVLFLNKQSEEQNAPKQPHIIAPPPPPNSFAVCATEYAIVLGVNYRGGACSLSTEDHRLH